MERQRTGRKVHKAEDASGNSAMTSAGPVFARSVGAGRRPGPGVLCCDAGRTNTERRAGPHGSAARGYRRETIFVVAKYGRVANLCYGGETHCRALFRFHHRPRTDHHLRLAAMTDLPVTRELVVLNVAFLTVCTVAKLENLYKIVKLLKLPEPEGEHVMESTFLSKDSIPYYVHLHIDTRRTLDKKSKRLLDIRLRLRKKPTSTPPRWLTKQTHLSDWAFAQVCTLSKEPKVLGFFDGEMRLPLPPPSAVALPITLGSRILAPSGMEYSADVSANQVSHFRWTKLRSGITVKVSYSREIDISNLAQVWDDQGVVVEEYAKGALER